MGCDFCGTLITRQQWAGLTGRPETALFNFEGKVIPTGSASLSIFTERLGQQHNTQLRFGWSQHIELQNGGRFAGGLAIGMAHTSLNNNWISTDPFEDDAAIPNNPVAQGKFDMSAGVFYSDNKVWGGISTTHLSQSDMDKLEMQMTRHYYVMAGYHYQAPGNWVLSPSIHSKTDLASMQIDLNLRATWNDKIWGGLTYRQGDAIAPMIGYVHPTAEGHKWRFGYSHDFTTSQISQHSNGSHEIMINYCWNIIPKETRYRDVRNMGG